MSYILIVDDEAELGALLQDILVDEGYQVRCSTGAVEALSIAEHDPPVLILLDITMPDLGGADFVARYRQLPSAGARLIAVSGIVNLAAEAARIGAHGFIVKPYEIDHLLETVAATLR